MGLFDRRFSMLREARVRGMCTSLEAELWLLGDLTLQVGALGSARLALTDSDCPGSIRSARAVRR